MSTLREKIIAIRTAEGLSQQEFCDITGAGLSAIKALEAGRSDQLNTKTLFAITNHPRFKKYVLFLVSEDDTPVEQELPVPNADLVTKVLNHLSADELDQLQHYVEFLVSKRK